MKKIPNVFLLGSGAKIGDKPINLVDLSANDVHVYLNGTDIGIANVHLIDGETVQEINADLSVMVEEKDMDLYPLVVLGTDEEKISIERIDLVKSHPNPQAVSLRESRKIHREAIEFLKKKIIMEKKGWSPRRIGRKFGKI